MAKPQVAQTSITQDEYDAIKDLDHFKKFVESGLDFARSRDEIDEPRQPCLQELNKRQLAAR